MEPKTVLRSGLARISNQCINLYSKGASASKKNKNRNNYNQCIVCICTRQPQSQLIVNRYIAHTLTATVFITFLVNVTFSRKHLIDWARAEIYLYQALII